MRKLVALAIGLWCSSAAANASQLTGAARVTCDGVSHVVLVTGFYIRGVEGEYTGIVLERRAVGICQSGELLTDFTQPFMPELSEVDAADYTCTFVIPVPELNIVYRYVPFGVKADGSLQIINNACDNNFNGSALVDCAGMPFERGTVEIAGFTIAGLLLRIVGCEQDCWPYGLGFDIPQEDFERYAEAPVGDLLGQVVDVYGSRTYCGDIGDPGYLITRIERSTSASCGPVPVNAVTWGSLKALFR